MTPFTRLTIRSACLGALVLTVAPWAGAQAPAAAPPEAGTAPLTSEQASYLFGLTFAEQLHSVGIGGDLSSEAMSRGMKEGLQGKKATASERQQIQEYVHTTMLASAARNKTAAQEFLAGNGKKPGVKTTASGLEYKVEKAGDPKAPAITAADEVSVEYRGTLLDGSEFDSSKSHGRPLDIPVGGVIPGWKEALVMMKPGAKWTLYVPPELAYGANPRPNIPGNSLLIFDLEILSVKPGQAAPPPGGPAPHPGAPQTPQ